MDLYALGVDLGGTTMKGGLVHPSHGLVHEEVVDTEAEEGADRVLDRVAALVASLQAAVPAGAGALGVGIGVPGVVALDRATVIKPPNLPGWDRIHVPEAIRRRLDAPLPIVVENDANVAALGSAFFGAGRSFDSFIMATLGTGVGGAIVHRHRLFRGASGAAGELGHMSVDYEGPLARSGIPGAVEAYIGQAFLSRHARFRLLNEDTQLKGPAGPELEALTPRQLYEAAAAGDEPARAVLAWAGHKLGCALGGAVCLLDIRKVVVGGGISQAGDFVLEPTRRALHQFVLPSFREGLEVVRETLGNEVALLGAACLVFEQAEDGA
ncbi:MAG: ROK family protein [Rubricoccaceae bacterium]|nr:ROK family protein [Rubricoccaceae bacterium]